MKRIFSTGLPRWTALAIIFAAACNPPTIERTTNGNNNAPATPTAAASPAPASSSGQMGGMEHGGMSHGMTKSSPNAARAPYDLQFIDTMMVHHQGAVDMAMLAGTRAQRGEMKTFAAQIATDQQRENAQMRAWRDQWYAGKPAAVNMEMPGMMDSMKDMDMQKIAAAEGKSFDLLFIEMMIPHHQGAIEMAREALKKAEHPEIKRLAQQIIGAQEAEIKKMQGWKAQWTR